VTGPTTSPSSGSPLRRRLPLVLAILLGTVVWKGGFGFFATSRDVTWRLAVPYGEVRKVVLEVWNDEGLVRREERVTPNGLAAELTQEIVLHRGPHRASAQIWLGNAQEARVFQKAFDPGDASALVLEPTPAAP
jgi:hypothetical protein